MYAIVVRDLLPQRFQREGVHRPDGAPKESVSHCLLGLVAGEEGGQTLSDGFVGEQLLHPLARTLPEPPGKR
jgi:hypothetical protein